MTIVDDPMLRRRAFIAMLPAVILSRQAWAQFGGQGPGLSPQEMEKRYGPVFEPTQDLSDWFEQLKRPDIADGHPHSDVLTSAISCCSAGDAYPIEILEDASPPHGGTVENGTARVTDPSKRQVIVRMRNSDGSVYTNAKYRADLEGFIPAITAPEVGKFGFHFSSDRVTREIDGNPTKTAWAFIRNIQGLGDYIYCVVPLPPST